MANTYYVDAATGSDANVGSVGAPFATPGKALGVAITAAAQFTIYTVQGSYTTTTNTANVAGGRLNLSLTGVRSGFNRIIGITSLSDLTPVAFSFTLGATFTGPLVTMNNANSFNIFRKVNLIGNGVSGASAVNMAGRSNRLTDWKVSGFGGGGATLVSVVSNATIKRFEISGGATGNNAALSLNTCVARQGWVHGNAGRGIQIDGGAMTISRIASTDHTGANGYGFYHATATELAMDKCTGDNNAQSGLYFQNSDATATLELCDFTRNGGYGIENAATSPDAVECDGCGFYSNTSGNFQTTPNYNENQITYSALPFAGSGNYTHDADGLVGNGITYVFPGGGCSSFDDAGVVQHADAGGSAGTVNLLGGKVF